jgi:hypothetical protein
LKEWKKNYWECREKEKQEGKKERRRGGKEVLTLLKEGVEKEKRNQQQWSEPLRRTCS